MKLQTSFQQFEKLHTPNKLQETTNFEDQDLTPGAEQQPENEPTAGVGGPGGKVGTIADDHALDLTKRAGTLGNLLEPFLTTGAKMTSKEAMEEFHRILDRLGLNPHYKRTVSKWRLWADENKNIPHARFMKTMYEIWLSAGSLDVGGKGVGGVRLKGKNGR